MKKIILSTAIFATTFLMAQSARKVGEFSKLKVYDRMNVELIHSSKSEVEISGSAEDDVEVVNKNGELKIRMAPAKIMQGDGVKVKVYYSGLNDIQGSQGAVIHASGNIKSSLLSVTANEGSKINLGVQVDKLNAKGNSGGEITLSGTAVSQDIVMNSGAQFFGKELRSKNAEVTVNAGGLAQVYADTSVNTTTRAGGTIEVYGDPEQRNSKKVVGGKVVFK